MDSGTWTFLYDFFLYLPVYEILVHVKYVFPDNRRIAQAATVRITSFPDTSFGYIIIYIWKFYYRFDRIIKIVIDYIIHRKGLSRKVETYCDLDNINKSAVKLQEISYKRLSISYKVYKVRSTLIKRPNSCRKEIKKMWD